MAGMTIPRPEYPRPDFQRAEWMNLNGEWQFEFDDREVGEKEHWYAEKEFSGRITVPFCYQSKMSGIGDTGFHEIVWYKREFSIPESFKGKSLLLNFGAVDYLAKVWVNGRYVGSHKGGHVSFKMDISAFVKEGANTLTVRAEDRYECVQPRGKQYWKEKPDRSWYTATSGIWQTVWLETAGDAYIDKIRLTPDLDRKNVLVELSLNRAAEAGELVMAVSFKGNPVRWIKVNAKERFIRQTIDIREEDSIDEIHYWTPEQPNLYDVRFTLVENGKALDEVDSYFGMRKISVKGDWVLLNNKPYYMKLILDQGYWHDSLLTPPSDEAIVYDIEMTKKFGFNGARKHQKVEDPRYYYWADRLGLLVWGEMPSPYEFNQEEVENVTREWVEFINRDYNHPSIVAWVPLNESWGVRNILVDHAQQNFGRSLYYLTKSLDTTRLVSTNDGWEQVDADICAIHDYVAWGGEFTAKYSDKDKAMVVGAGYRLPYAEGCKYNGQPVLITEYGGIAFESGAEENWGYGGAVKDEESFLKRYASITGAIRETGYIRGYCYTQLTDVMQEINGLMTADRKVKIDIERIREINK